MQILFPTWQAVVSAMQTQPQWQERLLKWYHHQIEATLHLVILREPYLTRILIGQKRIESRFACDRRPPFDRVSTGDILLLKRAGGPLAGLALAKQAISCALTPEVFNAIRRNYATDLAIDNDHFWERQTQKRFVTLVWMSEVCPLPPIPIPHRDRRGWVLIRQ
jgi:hypothetical protein